jgi:hypothetical protein
MCDGSGAIHAEGLDLSLVGDPLWTARVRIANPKADEAVPEEPRLALDPHDCSTAVIDGEVIAQSSRQWTQHALSRAHESRGNLEFGQIADRSGVFHPSRLA